MRSATITIPTTPTAIVRIRNTNCAMLRLVLLAACFPPATVRSPCLVFGPSGPGVATGSPTSVGVGAAVAAGRAVGAGVGISVAERAGAVVGAGGGGAYPEANDTFASTVIPVFTPPELMMHR